MASGGSRFAFPVIVTTLSMLILSACAPGQPRPSGSAPTAETRAPSMMVVAVRGEPPSIAAKPVVDFTNALARPAALFNANLDFVDEREHPQPYLAEALPQLNTDTWRVFPDGRMETTYHLKPNLTWHDGTPLTADDFVFAWQVYSTPEFGVAKSPPIGLMEDVQAPDDRTVVIRWRQPYPGAESLADASGTAGFQALPRHLLQDQLAQLDPIAFAGLPFWTSEYVGLGPYRVTEWDAGTAIEGEAFDGYVFGRPRIDRVRLVFMADPQTAVANILSGAVQMIADPVLAVTDGQVLEQQWSSNKGGSVLYSPVGLRTTVFQMRPEAVEHQALLDVRVRKAVAHAMDQDTAVQVLTAGKGVPTDTLTHPAVDYYAQIERVIEKHPYDPRQAQQLMRDAGYPRNGDGWFAGADGQTVRFSVASSAGTKNEQEVAAYVDTMKQAGFDVYPRVVSAAEIRDPQLRALLPGVQIRGGADVLTSYTTQQIPRPDNRWHGDNRGGWSNADFDRVVQTLETTLDQSQRVQLTADAERIISLEVPIIPNYFGVYTVPIVAALKGPVARQLPPDRAGPFVHVHTWELRS